MNIQELTVSILGPTWPTKEFEIEGVSVLEKREYDTDKVSVTVKDFTLSNDNLLNVFIFQTAPNGTEYTVEITGKIVIDGAKKKINFSSDSYTTKFGKVRIDISENINDITE